MNGYFYVLTTIDIFVLGFMCILTKLSESLNQKQKRGFFLAFFLIAMISLLEVVTIVVDGAPKKISMDQYYIKLSRLWLITSRMHLSCVCFR